MTNFHRVQFAASPLAATVWQWSAPGVLKPGQKIAFECSDREEARRLQRWFFRERKRAIRDILNTTPGLDPDLADTRCGIVTNLDGASLVLSRSLSAFKSIKIISPDGAVKSLPTGVPKKGAKKRHKKG